jgi:hypothetical protein
MIITTTNNDITTGGRMNSDTMIIDNNSYRFDTGPSLLLLPDVYKKTFTLFGEDINDHVSILKVSPLYRCYFEEDNTSIDIDSNLNTMANIIKEKYDIDTYNNFKGPRLLHYHYYHYRHYHHYHCQIEYMKTATDFLNFGIITINTHHYHYHYHYHYNHIIIIISL